MRLIRLVITAIALSVTAPCFSTEGDTPRDVALVARSARAELKPFEQDIDKFLAKLSTNKALQAEILELAKKGDKEGAAKLVQASLRPGTEVVVNDIKDAFCIDFTATWKVKRHTYTLHIKIGWCD